MIGKFITYTVDLQSHEKRQFKQHKSLLKFQKAKNKQLKIFGLYSRFDQKEIYNNVNKLWTTMNRL